MLVLPHIVFALTNSLYSDSLQVEVGSECNHNSNSWFQCRDSAIQECKVQRLGELELHGLYVYACLQTTYYVYIHVCTGGNRCLCAQCIVIVLPWRGHSQAATVFSL